MCNSRFSAAHIRLKRLQEFHIFPSSTYQTLCFGRIQDYAGATSTLVRGIEIPGMAVWRDSGSSRPNSQVEPWRGNPENNGLTCFKFFKRLSSNEAGHVKRELGGRVHSNIVDASWVSGPSPPPLPPPPLLVQTPHRPPPRPFFVPDRLLTTPRPETGLHSTG
eukprot:173532-Pyramimonas_sp.AAC.1